MEIEDKSNLFVDFMGRVVEAFKKELDTPTPPPGEFVSVIEQRALASAIEAFMLYLQIRHAARAYREAREGN